MARFQLTAESATEGQPDKLCDLIADSILDRILAEDRFARVGCDIVITTGLVLVTGEVTTRTHLDIGRIVRETLREVGYTGHDTGFDCASCAVLVMLNEQSPEVGLAIDRREAGDECIVVGYATNEGEKLGFPAELMPVPIVLAHALARRLAEVRKAAAIPRLLPDGESQVTVEYEEGRPVRIAHALLSAHHAEGVDSERLRRDLVGHVLEPVLRPTGLLEPATVLSVNSAGSFTRGGPQFDSGLTGRKIVSDAYGTNAKHGGSSLSGKDPTKIDRSAAYMTRHLAKNVVAAGVADRCEVQLAYAPGRAEPVSVTVDSFQTGRVPDHRIAKALLEGFDLTPAGIIDLLELRRPIYRALAVYGHFGRPGLPWERIDPRRPFARLL